MLGCRVGVNPNPSAADQVISRPSAVVILTESAQGRRRLKVLWAKRSKSSKLNGRESNLAQRLPRHPVIALSVRVPSCGASICWYKASLSRIWGLMVKIWTTILFADRVDGR